MQGLITVQTAYGTCPGTKMKKFCGQIAACRAFPFRLLHAASAVHENSSVQLGSSRCQPRVPPDSCAPPAHSTIRAVGEVLAARTWHKTEEFGKGKQRKGKEIADFQSVRQKPTEVSLGGRRVNGRGEGSRQSQTPSVHHLRRQ